MASKAFLTAQPREILGKKVKTLRRQGILPANIYGKGIDSTPIQLDLREFVRILRADGTRVMFELTLDGESTPRPVLIRGLHRLGGTGDPIHADFYQVSLDQPITTRVGVVLVGTATAATDLGGTLIHNVDTVTVRCLPNDIPDTFEIDISRLTAFEDAIHIEDIPVPPGVTIEDDPSVLVATVAPPRLLTEEEEEGEELEGEEAEGEGEEGEAAPDAETSTESADGAEAESE